MSCLYDSLSQIMKKNVEKKSLLNSLDMVIVAIDEICDGGILLESDPNSVVQKVNVKMEEMSFNEQTLGNVFQSAREQLKWSLLR